MVLGDTESQDKCCGKYQYRGKYAGCVCCQCDIHTHKLCDEYANYHPTKQDDIQTLIDESNQTELQKISYHYIENAFHGIEFGGFKYGINGNTPFGCLHTTQLGVMKYAV